MDLVSVTSSIGFRGAFLKTEIGGGGLTTNAKNNIHHVSSPCTANATLSCRRISRAIRYNEFDFERDMSSLSMNYGSV